jgi:biotin transporter BioY
MRMYIIMSFMMGFTANKLFNKNNKSTSNSTKWGCIVASILIILYLMLKK